MTHAENIWPDLRAQAEALGKSEPALAALLHTHILSQKNLLAALSSILSSRLASADVDGTALQNIFAAVHQSAPEMEKAAQYDLISIMKNDPAAHDLLTPFLFFKGFHALQAYRIAHWLYHHKREHLALHLQNRISEIYGVDIHPAARIGHGVMMDHATGIVIGETAVVEDDVLFWHGVTLGGKILITGDRHPKIRKGTWLGAGATVLGPVNIGAGARIAAGSIVMEDVAAGATIAGAKAQVIRKIEE